MKTNKLLFHKKGLIFKSINHKWIKSHAWVPTVYKLKNNKVIIFFAGRNNKNESDIGYIVFDLDEMKVTKFSKKPILKRGPLGSFDDSAVIPSHMIKVKDKFYLYYVGWTQGKKVPFFSSIGLAISKSPFGPFKRYSSAPIIGVSKLNPYFVATCYVRKYQNGFEMYYTSNTSWSLKKKRAFPRYLIKKCNSKDGINWKIEDNKLINFYKKSEIAITRPWILNLKNKTVMFYSLKKRNYKICTVIFKNKRWIKENIFEFKKNKSVIFDNVSQEYASLIKYKKKIFMFYNGNEYGKNGIGLAISQLYD